MSQAYLSTTSTPSVPTDFTTDSGTAVPVGNNLNIFANDVTTNNENGITTTGSGDTVTISLTNRLYGTGTTVGATTADLVTFGLGATDAVYVFVITVAGRDAASGDGLGYQMKATFKTDGATATAIDIPEIDDDEDAAITASDITMVASGNNAIIRVTGVAGFTITWAAQGEYLVV